MHGSIPIPVVAVQLVLCLCCVAVAYPTSGRRLTSSGSQLPDPSSSEELLSSGPASLELYRPKLLTLLQLGLLSSKSDSESSDSDEDESRGDLENLKARFQVRPAFQKKLDGLSLDRGDGPPRLSIVNPLDVLRQKMLLEMLRVRNETTQRIVDENAKVMEKLGKRSTRDNMAEDGSVVRPSRHRISQMLSSLVSRV